MSTTEADSSASSTITPHVDTPSSGIAIATVPADEREQFDTEFRAATVMHTPLAPASEAFIATDAATGDVLGVSYIHVRHLMGPYALTEGAPPETLSKLSDAITDQLRAVVRESLLAQHQGAGNAGDAAQDVGLSYDVYVVPGTTPPAGFERLDVEVWRRRVC